MNISNYNIGKTITWLRKNANMTQQQLASVLNVSHQAVSKWENGLALPDYSAMLAISKLFGVTIEQIITGNIPGRIQDEETYTFDSLFSFAGKAVKAAQDLGDTIAKGVNKVVASVDEFANESTTTEEETQTNANVNNPIEYTVIHNTMSLDSLIDIAPFMSKEKLSEEVLYCTETPNLSQLCRLAPYLNSETIESLITRCSGDLNADVLARLAPFLRKEQLFKLISRCPDALTLNNLRRFAPFLKRGMVDTLVETITRAKQVVSSEDIRIQTNNVLDNIRDKISRAVTAITEQDTESEETNCNSDDNTSEATESNTDSPADAPVEIKIVSSEFKDKVARAALKAHSWVWLNAHIGEIADEALMLDIAIESSKIAQQHDLFIEAFKRLTDINTASLTDHLILNEKWELLSELSKYLSSDEANKVILAAFEQATNSRDAFNTVESCASYCDSQTLHTIIEHAVAADNWQLIDILTKHL